MTILMRMLTAKRKNSLILSVFTEMHDVKSAFENLSKSLSNNSE